MNNLNEDGAALICIPDISGFTKFMAETDIEFSRKIIPPLLRTIVSSNLIKMEVGEIEGDAVVFYRFGALPTMRELLDQCTEFFTKFIEQLEQLENDFAAEFEQHHTSANMSLKIICHAAEITSTHIEGITKLIGEDMVVVHKLLKNSIQESEYILLTDKLLACYTSEALETALEGQQLLHGFDEYEHIGKINYKYLKINHFNVTG